MSENSAVKRMFNNKWELPSVSILNNVIKRALRRLENMFLITVYNELYISSIGDKNSNVIKRHIADEKEIDDYRKYKYDEELKIYLDDQIDNMENKDGAAREILKDWFGGVVDKKDVGFYPHDEYVAKQSGLSQDLVKI